MAPARKTFTRDEANALIPYLQQTVDTLQQQIKEVVRLKRQLEILNLICDSPVSPQNLDFQEYLQKTARYHQLVGQADGLIKEIRGKGCLLRDLHAGIVDFYAEMGGRVVFLCWRRGEGQITYWHPVDQGYGQRRVIAGNSQG
jgi:hypothetical protein